LIIIADVMDLLEFPSSRDAKDEAEGRGSGHFLRNYPSKEYGLFLSMISLLFHRTHRPGIY
jgi:hypothetical protein